MYYLVRLLFKITLLSLCLCSTALAEGQPNSTPQVDQTVKIPILAYHRFGPSVADGMTIKTNEFEQQLKWLKEHNYTVVPLKMVVSYLRGEGPTPPPRAVVITADDGHKSVFTDMQPIVKKYNIPVTLFIYPSAISNASYAMTWEQLQKLKDTGLFDIQGHTYWHPNFKKEKKKMSPEEYQKFVNMQLNKSKSVLEKKTGNKIEFLAWPFGIYDEELGKEAQKAGYMAAFSIERHCASKSQQMMSQPRYMIVNGPGIKGFAEIMAGATQGPETNQTIAKTK